MTSPLDNPGRWAVLGLTVFALACVGLIADHAPAVALVNESPSLPKGLYVRKPGAKPVAGAIVALPQPSSVRAYLDHLGMPRDVLLIKRVAATSGDRVCAVAGHIVLPTQVVRVLAQDRQGASLPIWSGCRRLEPHELFLLGDTPGSFDSRYFGPVHDDEVDGVFAEILTW